MHFRKFTKLVQDFYKSNRRDLPWRPPHIINPYRIVVSEIMLQQTQVHRVIPKYQSFIKTFPDWQTLARAPFKKVLQEWTGLGYNRRALGLHHIAQIVVTQHNGLLPHSIEQLIALPSIGPNTAASICAFAFNMPVVFIETNIRTVFIHYFFQNQNQVHDDEIRALVEKTLNRENPREWYYALMDLGTHIKGAYGNPNTKSRLYRKQSPFQGSNRELRSLILKMIASAPSNATAIMKKIKKPKNAILKNLRVLEKEGFLQSRKGIYAIT